MGRVAQASLARVDFLTPDPLPIVGTRAKVALPTGGGMPSRREKGRVSTKTVRRYIADGHLHAVRLGRKTLWIKLESIERSSTRDPWAGGGGRVSVPNVPRRPARCSTYLPRKQVEALEGPLTCSFSVGDTGFEPVPGFPCGTGRDLRKPAVTCA